MAVSLISEYTPELRESINRLIPQLSTSTPPLSEEFLRGLLAQPGVYVFGYWDDAAPRTLLGMLTLATFDIPTGKRGWIEDVVVDQGARGHGAGQKLVEAAVAHGKSIGAKSIDLTSRPSREAANRLYQRAGFALRETNLYRFNG